ncbi:MAG: cytochrome P450 [Propioniciclava sp.]|uniref:cytochrome P450 n=1 Tax=Propioniciclava sp. TaxID=2038686 RepID=UPI0039E5D748
MSAGRWDADSDRLITRPDVPAMDGEDEPRLVRLHHIESASRVLRDAARTRQAGFTSERIPHWMFRRRPILFDDGEAHDRHRSELARFFAPQVLQRRHGSFIRQTAQERVGRARAAGGCLLDELALHYSVAVASAIVGLTESPVEQLAQRLTRFFEQPPVDHTKLGHGRTTKQWIEAARRALVPLLDFHLRDVRPAIKRRRKQRADDIISFLLDQGYRPSEVLMECLTYGTAGMVTTREFICAAFWHLARNEPLRDRYLGADQRTRHRLLHEIIRVEPPVGHLYRRVVADDGPDEARAEPQRCPYPAGTLVDIDVRAANLDPERFGERPGVICPDRDLRASDRSGLSFGDGPHRCPGAPLALLETDALLLELFAAGATVVTEPVVQWDTLLEGYQLREFRIGFASGA